MPKLLNKKLIVVACWFTSMSAGTFVHAAATQAAPENVLKTTMQMQHSTQQSSARSQEQVNRISDETQSLLTEYLTVTQQTDRLRVYNQHGDKVMSFQALVLMKAE